MYRLRYHLAKGENYKKWQLKNMETKTVDYFNPDEFYVVLKNAKLKNQKSTAQKIYKGINKTVCAWIEFNEYILYPNKYPINNRMKKLYYNPKHLPFWTDFVNTKNINTSKNWDNWKFEKVIINQTNIYKYV